MNKEITIYELLRLIKDGQAPKKIIETQSDGWKEEYILDIDGWYMTVDGTTKMNIYEPDRLNDKVEIIEEDNNVIGKILTTYDGEIIDYVNGEKHLINTNRKDKNIYIPKINELIDEIKALKENK